MLLKLLALIYRKTGWFCPLIYIYQYHEIINSTKNIQLSRDNLAMNLKEAIGLQIGLWQAKNGFYRKRSL